MGTADRSGLLMTGDHPGRKSAAQARCALVLDVGLSPRCDSGKEETPEGHPTHLAAKAKGDHSLSGKRETDEDV